MIKTWKEKGFTLVELMVAVGIVGIIASIAITNYKKHVMNTKRAEVKIALAGAWEGMMTFKTNYGTFTSCLSATGFKHDAPVRYYSVGWCDASLYSTCGPGSNAACNIYSYATATTGTTCSYGAPNTCYLANASINPTAWPIPTACGSGTGLDCGQTQGVSRDTFIIQGRGSISTSGGGDYWTIDQNKTLLNTAGAAF